MKSLFTQRLRPVLFAIAALTLVVGLVAGLARLQITASALAAHLAVFHGPLLISGFFGTVISLERAVAIQTPMAYAAPLINVTAAVLLLFSDLNLVVQTLSILAAVMLTAMSLQLLRKVKADFTIILGVAAGCWIAGGFVWWLTQDPSRATLLWFGFLVITIAGERLELTRFLPTPSTAKRWFYLIVLVLVLGGLGSASSIAAAAQLFSLGLITLAVWLSRFDIARHNIRQTGVTRYIAICLLSGYAWLGLAGILGLFGAFDIGSPLRDGALHALGLGFVMAMVFGHALIILPAVARIKVPYHAAFYLPLGLLHGSLLLRVIGKWLDIIGLQQLGAMANTLTFLVFAAVMIWRVRSTTPTSARPATHS